MYFQSSGASYKSLISNMFYQPEATQSNNFTENLCFLLLTFRDRTDLSTGVGCQQVPWGDDRGQFVLYTVVLFEMLGQFKQRR